MHAGGRSAQVPLRQFRLRLYGIVVIVAVFRHDDLIGSRDRRRWQRQIDRRVAAGQDDDDDVAGPANLCTDRGQARTASLRKDQPQLVPHVRVEAERVEVGDGQDLAPGDGVARPERQRGAEWQHPLDGKVERHCLIVPVLGHDDLMHACQRQRADVESDRRVGARGARDRAVVRCSNLRAHGCEAGASSLGNDDRDVIGGRADEREDVEVGGRLDRAASQHVPVRHRLPVCVAGLGFVLGHRRPAALTSRIAAKATSRDRLKPCRSAIRVLLPAGLSGEPGVRGPDTERYCRAVQRVSTGKR